MDTQTDTSAVVGLVVGDQRNCGCTELAMMLSVTLARCVIVGSTPSGTDVRYWKNSPYGVARTK